MTGFRGIGSNYPKLVGWCETNYGFMGVFECPFCGTRFRFHGGDPCDDLDEFENKLILFFGEKCTNWNEIERELNND
jgi:hypothetical protein